jgi:hypothetical protein
MQFIAPIKFQDAIDKLGARSPIGSQMSSEQWSAVPVALRERAFFSANIESARFLQDMKTDLLDFQNSMRDGSGALKVGSRAKFIENMRRKAIAQGLGPIDPEDAGTIKDIRGERRLGLVFDVQTKSARSFGDRKQGMDPDVLQKFPGVRFIRVAEVTTERSAHKPFEGIVFLKTDLKMFARINIDFGGVPWAPFGWGCHHDIEDADRDTTDSLGLTHPGKTVPGVGDEDFNKSLKSSVKNLDPEVLDFLMRKFGDQVTFENGEASWNSNPAAPVTEAPSQPDLPFIDPAPSEWAEDMDAFGKQYESASQAEKDGLIEQAHVALEIPQENRRGISIDNKASRAIAQIAKAGNDVIARFVRPSITQNVKLSLYQTQDDRAFHRAGGVYLNLNSDRSTAAHEIMHGIELQNPSLLRAAAEFSLKRGAGELPQKLSKLTGNKEYWSSEVALEDDWLAHGGRVYAGKVYSETSNPTDPNDIRATEILTIGIERMLADPIDFYLRDPEWFQFIVETVGVGPSQPSKLQ